MCPRNTPRIEYPLTVLKQDLVVAKHINKGELLMASPAGLIMEGRRRNILSSNPFAPPSCVASLEGADFLGLTEHPKFPSLPVLKFRLKKHASFRLQLILPCQEVQYGYTFSFFAVIKADIPITLKSCFGDENERTCQIFIISDEVRRFELPLQFAQSPKKLSVVISIDKRVTGEFLNSVDFILAMPSIEEGLFASTPIPKLNERLGEREGEQLSYKREKNFFSGEVCTTIVNFVPMWNGYRLTPNVPLYLLDCLSDDKKSRISIFADSNDSGRLKALIRCNGQDQVIPSDVVPLKNTSYSVALRWAGGLADFLVNGRNVTSAQGIRFPAEKDLGENVFICSTSESRKNSAFCFLKQVVSYENWLNDQQIRSCMFIMSPEEFPEFRLDYELNLGEEKPDFIKNQEVISLARQVLAFPSLWQEAPPVWLKSDGLKEEDCRDEILRALRGKGYQTNREHIVQSGRTDLLIEKADPLIKMRFEFKIWGRHDYNCVPEKPLKYFLTGENFGVVVMINPNKSKLIGLAYRNNVRAASSEFDFVDLIEQPFGKEQYPDHFLTIHRSKAGITAEVLHVVFERYGPFASKGS